MAKSKVDEQAVIELIINNEKSKTSIKEVRQTMIGLERQLLNMKKDDDPAGFEKLRKQLDQVRKAHTQMVGEIRGGDGAFSRMKLNWKEMITGAGLAALAYQGVQKAIQLLPGLANTAGELSDQLADVSKQTGITGQQLQQLNKDLEAIDTRTPVEQLRQLAAVAGKLGYGSREDVLAFVKAADVLNVALGEDLGGNVEETLNDIGKLVAIFGLEEEFGIEKSMLKIGSAINTVGASSQANEGYLVQWAKRFAGIAPNAGISIADTLGMAAAADILGQSSELSSTNIGKMVIAMGKDVPYFARIASMQVKDFSTLLKTDGNEAFLRVLEGARSTTKGVEGLAKMLENLGIEGSEGAAVLGAFAKNTELVRKQQDIANASFEKGTSVIDEFNVKNQNWAAIMDKIEKKLNGYWERAAEGLGPFIEMFGKWAGVVTELDLQLKELNDQQQKVVAVESKFPVLLRRYDELKSKSKLSTEEQAELQKIINTIADEIPEAATGFDKYGNALDFSRGKATEFIESQRTLLETMRQTRRDMLKEEISDLQQRAKVAEYELNLRQKYSVNSGGQLITSPFTKEDFESKRKEAKSFQDQIVALKKDLDALEGRSPVAAPQATTTDAGKPAPKVNLYAGPSKDQAKEALKAQKQLAEDLMKNQQKITLSMLEGQKKEIQDAQFKYDELRKRAGKNAVLLESINEQHGQEVLSINKKYNKKYLEDFDKTVRSHLDGINRDVKEEAQYEQQRRDDEAKRRNKDLFEINNHYQEQIALAKAHGKATTELEKQWKEEVSALTKKQSKESTDDFLAGILNQYRSEMSLADEAGTSKEDIVRNQLERLRLLREKYGTMDIEHQKLVNSEIAKADRELLAIKLDQISKTGQAMTEGGKVIADVLTLTTDNQNEYAEFQKALGLFQIAVDTGTAVASAVAAGTKGDPYTVALRIAAAVAAVTAGMVKAKQLINAADQPERPAFRAEGGPTDLASIQVDKSGNPQGWVSQPTLFSLGRRSYVAGEAGTEYVISNRMLRNPVVADFANMLETMRSTGRAFADGGSTAMPAMPMAPYADLSLAETNMLLRKLLDKDSGWNYNVFEKYQDQIDLTRLRASA
ncbi:phage tail tape measure protein, TP901 family, core region [Dyadobacter soli]|uniref:Phage tail tape measure protein, TP901 family, core region n=1 Tax=Dyadobacter soli TaxID=659014 RepID=A0A1G7B1I9_9BACT|nr:phage tail tape measure protein [Dyadobacter soli]SDE20126.1 phage tail tape measure protein, TP901 family, core region [Dyadobacter soli]